MADLGAAANTFFAWIFRIREASTAGGPAGLTSDVPVIEKDALHRLRLAPETVELRDRG
jgi:hypothetical protein